MTFSINNEYAKLGQEVLDNVAELNWLTQVDCRIGFMGSAKPKKSKGNTVLGECILVNELYKEFCPYDFLIVFYEPNIEGMNHQQLKILAEHELRHVGYEESANGEPRYFINSHDYEEFKKIIEKYGADWTRNAQQEE